MSQFHVKTTDSVKSEHAVTLPWHTPKLTPTEWLHSHRGAIDGSWRHMFDTHGFISIPDIIDPENVEVLRTFYDDVVSGKIDSSSHRHDLSGQTKEGDNTGKEKIMQVMWPTDYILNSDSSPVFQRALLVARLLLKNEGEVDTDIAFDFDMLIFKAPHSAAETPWHQDAAYWPQLTDKRAVSIWCALDDVTVNSGCMWFAPPPSDTLPDTSKEQYATAPHRSAREGSHVLTGDFLAGTTGVPLPLAPGGCTLHNGHTPHYSRGNTTPYPRRAYIMNFRPQAMVDMERGKGFDHGRKGVDSFEAVKTAKQQ